MFVKLNNNNEIEKYPYSIEQFREDNSNLSLPIALSDAFLSNYGIYPVYFGIEPDNFDKKTQKKTLKSMPILIGDRWVLEWEVSAKTEYEIALDTQELSAQIRKQRDDLLKDSDWMASKAFETNTPMSVFWTAYRQALRDLSSQDGFPYDITWPEKPLPQ